MQQPDFHMHGWSLDDGEVYHRRAPTTFPIPSLGTRNSLRPGDFAKLIFVIAVDNTDEPIAYERMWVLVRDTRPGGYLGVLDNDPTKIAKNEMLWSGTELPFEARHVIAVLPGDESSRRMALLPPRRPWLPS
jgi:hypothetical protein